MLSNASLIISVLTIIQIHSFEHRHEEAVLVSVPDKAQLSAPCPAAIKVQQFAFHPAAYKQDFVRSRAMPGTTIRQSPTHASIRYNSENSCGTAFSDVQTIKS